MSTTAMHFGPEWMRPKTQTSRSSSTREPSPPPAASPAPTGASTYSALLTPSLPAPPERVDGTNPFKYSRDEMLRIYKEGGGRGGLGLEVERWEGVVREAGSDPTALKEMTEAEKKLFAGPLNSEIRRRQSTDYLSPINTGGGERPKLYHANSGAASPMRERFGGLLGRRRDSSDQPSLTIPRKSSMSSNGPLHSPREPALPSPRARSGFDGVLSGSDSWMARRRASDATKPGAIRATESGDGRLDPEIKEEEEDEGGRGGTDAADPGQGRSAQDPHITQPIGANGNTGQTAGNIDVGGLGQGLGNMQLGGPVENHVNGGVPGGGAPLVQRSASMSQPLDLASVEWSYIDPQGNIQGPFRADIMQNWHDAGFFTPDLLMKRTQLDTIWTTVGDMISRADTNQIFLIPPPPPPPIVPPGLPRRADSIPDNAFPSPFQPVPQRSLRSATLDTYLGGGSPASNSPSSSFGQFGTGSPDPSAFGGRAGLYSAGDPIVGSRLQNSFSATHDPNMQYIGRRATYGDGFNPYGAPFAGGIPQSPAANAFGYNGMDHSPVQQVTFDAAPNFSTGFGSPAFTSPAPASAFSPAPASINSSSFSGRQRSGSIGLGGTEYRSTLGETPNFSRGSFGGAAVGEERVDIGGQVAPEVNFTNSQAASVASQGEDPILLPQNTQGSTGEAPSPRTSARQAPAPPISVSIPTAQSSAPSVHSTQSPWDTVDSSVGGRRAGPFDAPHPKASNVKPTSKPAAPTTSVPRSKPASTKPPKNLSPWVAATQGIVSKGWSEAEGGASSLTFRNLAQHNQEQEENSAMHESPEAVDDEPLPSPTPEPTVEEAAASVRTPASTSVETPEPTAPTPKAPSKRKAAKAAAAAAAAAAASTPAPVSAPAPEVTSTTPATSSKPAWGVDDEKPKPSGVSMGFREIQEAEAKKLEARKVAEKDRAARATNAPSPASDETPGFTASWGLPTSKSGQRAAAAAKEGGAPPPGASAPATAGGAAVWTNVAKAAPAGKKGMKEIQDEEELRKKAAKDKDNAARRAYADTTSKTTPAPTPAATGGGAWQTVGATGKSSAPAAAPVRPPMSSIVSGATATGPPSVRSLNGASTTQRPSQGTAPKPASSSKDDFPTPPSQDFMKWLADSLKGLDKSVNYEDIISMLLSFPLDPDPSTTELIAEMIYANSTTLDGRRFAAEFVSKRKGDAASRTKAGAAPGRASGSGPSSIAEIVKAQPKPAQSEWGGFKVVNKKKRGGKA